MDKCKVVTLPPRHANRNVTETAFQPRCREHLDSVHEAYRLAELVTSEDGGDASASARNDLRRLLRQMSTL